MKIFFINNTGGGFASHIDIPTGTTVQELFHDRVRFGKHEDFLIRVNREMATADQQLREGDRVSVTGGKIEGAAPAA
jgi:hypothetical protein